MAGGDDQQPQDQENGSWAYHPEGDTTSDAAPAADQEHLAASADGSTMEWTASEFIAHEKSPLWYLTLAGIAGGLAAAIYLATRDVVSVVAVAILAGALGVAGARKPRIVAYRVDRGGITVGKRFHPYGNFKSFAVIDEDAFASITFLPMKRFSLPLSIYYSPEDEDRIMSILASHLPMEPGQLDSIDRFMRHIHF